MADARIILDKLPREKYNKTAGLGVFAGFGVRKNREESVRSHGAVNEKGRKSMNVAAKAFIKTMEEKGMKYRDPRDEDDGTTVVPVGFNLKNTSVQVLCIFDANLHTVALRLFELVHVNDEQYPKALLACNELNAKKRWVKFYIDKDNDLNLEDDVIIDATNAGETVFELLIRMVKIADDSYPVIQKALWA